ncbi:hypothetical protein BDV11DRAFT_178466 [Aspergillus similis]
MRAFWRASWMRSKISVSDDQRDHLLPENRDVDHLPEKETSSRAANTRVRYVGFGIGGAGNIRRVKPRGVAIVAGEAKDQ